MAIPGGDLLVVVVVVLLLLLLLLPACPWWRSLVAIPIRDYYYPECSRVIPECSRVLPGRHQAQASPFYLPRRQDRRNLFV